MRSLIERGGVLFRADEREMVVNGGPCIARCSAHKAVQVQVGGQTNIQKQDAHSGLKLANFGFGGLFYFVSDRLVKSAGERASASVTSQVAQRPDVL